MGKEALGILPNVAASLMSILLYSEGFIPWVSVIGVLFLFMLDHLFICLSFLCTYGLNVL